MVASCLLTSPVMNLSHLCCNCERGTLISPTNSTASENVLLLDSSLTRVNDGVVSTAGNAKRGW